MNKNCHTIQLTAKKYTGYHWSYVLYEVIFLSYFTNIYIMLDKIFFFRPVELEVWKQCYPQFLTKYSHLTIINCLFVMLIGNVFFFMHA